MQRRHSSALTLLRRAERLLLVLSSLASLSVFSSELDFVRRLVRAARCELKKLQSKAR